jgi:phosphoenolpyruvate carboxykinase (ATP)
MFHFLSGYTAKVAGTEAGITEPTATFSTCFGGPFMPLNPTVYGELLRTKIARHNVTCWLVNTGWSGGAYGVGSRMKIGYSRALVNAALNGSLNAGAFNKDAFFGLDIPTTCAGVPAEVLNPRNTWADKTKYDETATRLVGMFKENFKKYEPDVTADVANVM